MNKEKIGKFILELRNEKGISQEKLAEMISITRQSVSKWENGKTSPDSQTLIILSNIFNVTVNEILMGEYLTEDSVEEKQEKLILSLNDEYSSKQKKIKKLMKIIIILSLCSLVFFIKYFMTFYNSVKVYIVSGYSENFSTHDGVFITTREKSYLRLGKLIYQEDIQLEYLELYYKKGKEEIKIYSSDDSDFLLKDSYGYEAHFKFNNLSNVYLRITYNNGKKEEIKLHFVKNFANTKFKLKRTAKESIENSEKSTRKISSESRKIISNILEKFSCDKENICQRNIETEEEKILFTYFGYNKLLIIEEQKENKNYEWNYDIYGSILVYNIYENNSANPTFSKTLYLDKSKEEEHYFEIFKNKYLSKILE